MQEQPPIVVAGLLSAQPTRRVPSLIVLAGL